MFEFCDIGNEPCTRLMEPPVVPGASVTSLKSLLCDADWDKVRRFVYTRAGRSCQLCGGIGDTWPVAAEPYWEFDQSAEALKGYGRQWLVDVIALCPACLQARGDIRAYIRGMTQRCPETAVEILAKSREINYEQASDLIEDAALKSVRLGSIPWAVDLSWLVDTCGFDKHPTLADRSVFVLIDGVVVGGL